MKQERVVIDRVTPQLNAGQFSIKRVVGQSVAVSADILADGHDVIAGVVLYKHSEQDKWMEARMSPSHDASSSLDAYKGPDAGMSSSTASQTALTAGTVRISAWQPVVS